MAFKSISQYNEDKNKDFFILQNDGDNAAVVILYRSVDDALVADVHYIKSGDYSGYVHLSLAYTLSSNNGIIYAGDKLIQQCILYIVDTSDTSEVSEDEYIELMKNSKRGSKAFGSSDVKH